MPIDPAALWCCRLPAASFSTNAVGSRPPVHLSLFLISEHIFSSGKYLVSPKTYLTDSGRYGASVAVSSGEGASSHHRIFRFDQLFQSREAARIFAVTQGWLQTCSPRTVLS
jgi:hypothetical protein